MQTIHSGTTSIIYRPGDGDFDKATIIKQYKSHADSTRLKSRLANEYNVTRNATHPGIRKCLDYSILNGKPSLYLEYIDGAPISEIFKDRKRTVEEMLALAEQLAAILVELHQSNIIHKNLNATNILLRTEDHSPVVIDFSIAGRTSSQKHHLDIAEQLEGDPAYIAPEQSGRINRVVDQRTDLYSIGVVFYEIFAGRRPFTTTNVEELLHDHIARMPPPVVEIEEKVPEPVSDIIMKLLQKNPDDRYQSAFGLLRDLSHCREEYTEKGTISQFQLGTSDFSGRLTIPRHPFGREQELSVLGDACSSIKQGKCQRVLVSGHSGLGKTLLVKQLAPSVTAEGGLFIWGRFDQYQSKQPYLALNQIVKPLVRRILSLPVKQMQETMRELRLAIGNSCSLLVHALPALTRLFPADRNRESADTERSPEQLHAAIRRLFLVFASPKTPLVIFFDDLQWADSASLELLEPLFLDETLAFCLFIGAYSEDYLQDSQPFAQTAKTWSKAVVDSHIKLNNLQIESLNALISATLGHEPGKTQALAEVVLEKTGGAPLLVHGFLQSLYHDGILTFDYSRRHWQWDQKQLRVRTTTDDIVVSITEKIESLSTTARKTLAVAACIGNRFDVETLLTITDLTEVSLQNTLWELSDKQMLRMLNLQRQPGQTSPPLQETRNQELHPSSSPVGNHLTSFEVAFVHPQVRQAAYALLPVKEKRKIHLQLGRHLLATHEGQELPSEQLFKAADHCNEGFRYIESQHERQQVAGLNLMAAAKAKQAAAYQAAVWYLNMGIGLLPQTRWESCYELTRNLYSQAIEVEYLCRNYLRVALFAEELLKRARIPEDKSPAFKYQLLLYRSQNDTDKTMETAFAALEAFGVVSAHELTHQPTMATDQQPHIVDTTTVVKASHMLSEEIHLDQLLAKLMQVVIENAGAQRGLLLVFEGEDLVVQAEGLVGEKKIKTMQATVVRENRELPFSLVNYVARTGETVVLADAFQNGSFTQDSYVQKQRTRSVLCMPIVHKSTMAGLLYLENNLSTNVFTTDRLELLHALLTQAAISMENAKLYTRLEEKVQKLNSTQSALVSSRNWLDRIINTIAEPIFVKDRKHRWVLLNDAFCQFNGISRDLMLGKSDYDFYPKEEAEIFWEKDESVFSSGKENTNEEQFTDGNGQVHTIITKKALYIDENQDQFIVGIIRDITERINMEAQLRHAAKMEAVGTLAGGIAHDFNNLLTAILGYCDLLLLGLDKDSKTYRNVEQIKKAGESATSLTRQLLTFSRKQILQPKTLNLNQVVKDTEKMLQRLIGEDIVLESCLDENLQLAVADPILLEQVILNLSINARDAMPVGGRLTLESANVFLDKEYSKQFHEVTPGDYVMLAVSDTGVGMDAQTSSHIFEPFYTTKDPGKGTGLGLATVYGIIKQSGGHINVYSELEHGTTFKIYLPMADKGQEERANKEFLPEKIKGGSETILLAEDNTIVRDLAYTSLGEKGYNVFAASCGKEALKILQDLPNPPDLLVTDVVMPEMSGRELEALVSSMYPGIKTLYISGYTGDAITRHGVLDPNTNFLQKPFTPTKLAEKVRTILDSREEGAR